MTAQDIPVKCTRCRHQCMESEWPSKLAKIGGCDVSQKVCPKCGCKSYYDMRPQVAWCWATGLIEIGDKAPEDNTDGSGVIVIASGPKSGLYGVLSVLARHGQGASEGKLLVPGVPEADTADGAADMLRAWLIWCAKGNGKKHRHGVDFVRGR
jgi:hypothetical protein